MKADKILLTELAKMMKATVERCVAVCSREDSLKCLIPEKAQRDRVLILAKSSVGQLDLKTLFVLATYHYMFDLLVAHDERAIGSSEGRNIVFFDAATNVNIQDISSELHEQLAEELFNIGLPPPMAEI